MSCDNVKDLIETIRYAWQEDIKEYYRDYISEAIKYSCLLGENPVLCGVLEKVLSNDVTGAQEILLRYLKHKNLDAVMASLDSKDPSLFYALCLLIMFGLDEVVKQLVDSYFDSLMNEPLKYLGKKPYRMLYYAFRKSDKLYRNDFRIFAKFFSDIGNCSHGDGHIFSAIDAVKFSVDSRRRRLARTKKKGQGRCHLKNCDTQVSILISKAYFTQYYIFTFSPEGFELCVPN